MSKSFASTFQVSPGKFKLADVDPSDKCGLNDKDQAKAQTEAFDASIDEWQNKLYAEGKRSLLVVLQGIDSSGKDGTVRAVFKTCGPIGVQNTSFKGPTDVELAHDFLWRVHQAVPRKGYIGIFNRSHYEDVLIARVKKFASDDVIEQRYDQINHFEKMLAQNGVTILKFMLHISKDEQATRLKERVAAPAKRWKFNPADLEDRKLWNEYMAAYDVALNRCSTEHAPWHVIPANRNWVRNYVIGRIVNEKLEEMNPKFPDAKGWDPKTVVIE